MVVPSPPAKAVTLTGIVRRGHIAWPGGVFVHGHHESSQQYLFLHLSVPIDVLKVVSSRAPHWPVMHQYDIQLAGPDSIRAFVGQCVTATGMMASPGGIEGGPDWQPFPLTMFRVTMHKAEVHNGQCGGVEIDSR